VTAAVPRTKIASSQEVLANARDHNHLRSVGRVKRLQKLPKLLSFSDWQRFLKVRR